MISSIGCLILAAGESKRMGQPKQLLMWENQTFIEHTFNIAQIAGFEEIKIVLGAFSEKILPAVKNLKADILINHEWEKGMGSSLKFGLKEFSNKTGILVLLVDQPLIKPDYLKQMSNVFLSQKPLAVASNYENNPGPPAIFSSPLIRKILELNENNRAQKLLKNHLDEVIIMPFTPELKDFDFPEDFISKNFGNF